MERYVYHYIQLHPDLHTRNLHTNLHTIGLVLFEIPYRRASRNYQKDGLFAAPSNIVLALIREAKKVLQRDICKEADKEIQTSYI